VGLTGRDVGTRRWTALWHALWRPRWFLGGLYRHVTKDDLATHAAALSFYFLFSLFPFVLFLLALVTLLPGVQGIEDWLLGHAAVVMPGGAYATVESVVGSLLAQPRSGLLSLGAALALWSASTAVTGIMTSLNVAYGVPERRPWWARRLVAIAIVIGMSFFMILAFVLAVGSGPLAARVVRFLGPAGGMALLAGNWLVVLAAITLVTATLYHVCPDVDFPWRWFSPGSVLFTTGFTATTSAFSYWVSHFGTYDKTYGSLGAVIILLLWMYLIALLLLVGGQVNAWLDRAAVELLGPEEDVVGSGGEDDDFDLPAWAREDLRRDR
jgi:membrane protein